MYCAYSGRGGAEITLEKLMRLRRNSWGRSNGSQRSSWGSGAHNSVLANSSLLVWARFPRRRRRKCHRPAWLAVEGWARPRASHMTEKRQCSQQKLVSRTCSFHRPARRLLLRVGVGMGEALLIVAMLVPLAP